MGRVLTFEAIATEDCMLVTCINASLIMSNADTSVLKLVLFINYD